MTAIPFQPAELENALRKVAQRVPLTRDERALVQRSLDETPAALQTLEEFQEDAQALWDKGLRGEDFIRALGGGAPVHSGSDPDELCAYLESQPTCARTT
jgi:hypothetical protein